MAEVFTSMRVGSAVLGCSPNSALECKKNRLAFRNRLIAAGRTKAASLSGPEQAAVQAAADRLEKNNLVLAFRGTEGGTDWLNNLQQGTGHGSETAP